MWWQRLLGRARTRHTDIAEINIWRLQSLFNNFRRILSLNNAILANMARMEQALGGEYIYDKAFLENTVRTIASHVHHVTYNLNALTGNAYIPLYDRYQEIRTILDDIISGNTRALTCPPVLPLSDIGWELEPLVGIDLVCLAELRHHPGIHGPDGFVITSEGTRALTGQLVADASGTVHISTNMVRVGLTDHLDILLQDCTTRRLSIVVTQVDDNEELARELGRFTVMPTTDRSVLTIIEESLNPAEPAATGDTRALRSESNTANSSEPKHERDDSCTKLYVRSVERIIQTIFARLKSTGGPAIVQYAVFVRCCPDAAGRGIVQSRTAFADAYDVLSVTATPTDEEHDTDTYLLHRTYPFELLQSVIASHPATRRFADGRLATDNAAVDSGFGRGSALLANKDLKALAETAMALERMLGVPIALHWECLLDGTYRITRLFPLQLIRKEMSDDALAREQEGAQIICAGGQLVQSGVAAGSIVHVPEDMDPADFPAGAVAVARVASPQLTPILQRAAAVLTEYGSAAGHLATVARELRLPAVFAVPNALHLLPPGTEVTVDAGETTVYEGVLHTLLLQGSAGMELSPTDPEYRMLRRLLRFIMPLHLVDPDAADFSPEGCRSFHDIIHFCHERAVDELAHFQERRPGIGAIRTKRMRLDVPMDIRVLDTGGGMNKDAASEPTSSDICSEPFGIFLGGLLQPEAWTTDLPSLGFRDIISGMPRTMNMLAVPADTLGENLAIISSDYMNVSLRLGYHFSVIDANLGSDEQRNYVYFRFAGGLADPERRARRATFIKDVLEAMDFKVTVNGDLVIGRLKLVEAGLLRSALFILGALTAFSKQRDTSLATDADTRALFDSFATTFLGGFDRDISSTFKQGAPEVPGHENNGEANSVPVKK